jgi:hypothetical protein
MSLNDRTTVLVSYSDSSDVDLAVEDDGLP